MYTPVTQTDRTSEPEESGCSELEVLDLPRGRAASVAAEQNAPSTCFLIAINSFPFAYNLVVCTLGVLILPSEAVRLFLGRHAVMLGIMLGCTGVSQLISPAIGYISDRSTSRRGRRRPLLVAGGVLACLGSLSMLATRTIQLRYFYIASLTVTILGMNIRCVRAATMA